MERVFRRGTFAIFAECATRECRLVGDNTVDAEVKETLHVSGNINGPRVDLLASAMRPADESVVEPGLLHAQEIDVQSRRFTSIEREQVADGHARRESMHFQKRFVLQALNYNLVEHLVPAKRVDHLLSKTGLMATVVFQFNV